MDMLPDGLERDIDAQRDALERRVRASDLYTHEPEEFAVAHTAYRRIYRRLEVAEDLGSMTTPESRNLVRKVRLNGGALGVLKIVGNTREPGEGEVLDAWRRHGLPCAQPLQWGYERVSASRPKTATYLLTTFIAHRPLQQAVTPIARAAHVAKLVEFVRPFHMSGAMVSHARPWDARLGLHLRWTLPLVRRHRLGEPHDWAAKLHALSRAGHVIVHGDPAGSNVLEGPGGELTLLDPPGALIAMREADVGQICSQVGQVEHVDEMIDVACQTDPTLNPDAVACFAGLNLLCWSGYFLAGHTHPDMTDAVDADSEAAGAAVASAERYLNLAACLIDQLCIT